MPRILTIFFAFFLWAAGSAQAQQLTATDDAGPDQLLESLFSPITGQLNLSPEQRTQIGALAADEYARGEALLLRLNRLTAELDDEQSKETFDEDRVRALAAQAGQAMAEMTVVKLRVKARVMALLTPTQRALVAEQLRLRREWGESPKLY